MTLFETATELRVRLEAANAAQVGDDLMSRGLTLRSNIASAAKYLTAVESYRAGIGQSDATPLAAKEILEAVEGLREALAKSGPKALQHESAAALEGVLTALIARVDRWVKSSWNKNFAVAQESLDRVESGDLHGSPADRAIAQSRALKIQLVRKTDPVRDRSALEAHLQVEGLSACLERVNELVGELQAAIAAIDSGRAEMAPEVRAALKRAISVEGLPLRDMTPELLADLQSAGVVDDLVVRKL